MKLSHPLLDLPVETTARALVRGYLLDASTARERLEEEGDPDAVRALCTALRHIEIHLRLFRPYLGPGARKDRRRLRAMIEAGEQLRDLQAQTDRLRTDPGGEAPVEIRARGRMLRRLQERLARAERAFRSLVRGHFPPLRKRLARRTSSYVVEVDPGRLRPPLQTREAVAELVARGAARLRRRLERVRGPTDGREALRLLSEVRRLRSLLEPIQDEHQGTREVVLTLRALQEVLADLRDGERLIEFIASEARGARGEGEPADAGLQGLLGRIRARQSRALGEFEARFPRGPDGTLAGAVHGLAAQLRSEARPDQEIERKYLLRGMPPLPASAGETWIEQGWIPGDRLLERVRRVSTREGDRCYRTVKLGAGVRRVEVEEETTAEVFAALWPLTEGRRIRKHRFRVSEAGGVWEIDRFADLDLVLAEIELESPDAVVSFPPWLEPWVEREVTDDPAYVNANLAKGTSAGR